LARGRFLSRGRTRARAAMPTVEADVRHRDVVHRRVIDIGDVDIAEIIDGAIVEKVIVIPVTADKADAEIAEAVMDTAIEADGRPPITGMPEIAAIAPAPIARRPQHADGGRHHPGARHPVITFRSPGPVAR